MIQKLSFISYCFALMASIAFVGLMSGCDNAKEEKLTDAEQQLLHQTPEYDRDGVNELARLRVELRQAYTTDTVDGWRITRDGQGYVTRVEFEDISQQQPPADAKAFLVRFFGEEAAAKFVKVYNENYASTFEKYELRCGDLTVSSYSFEYSLSGVMLRAYGEYYPSDVLNPNPNISSYLARKILATYYDASVSSIEENARLRFELFPAGNHFVPRLIYNPRFKAGPGPTTEQIAAYIDAHTGRLICVYFEFI